MDQNTNFVYRYSAKDNKEVQEIRSKYVPREESKMDELRRLDGTVQGSGIIESLCVGVGGVLVFGLGLCLTMQVIGSGAFLVVLGVMLAIIGIAGMVAAYPVFRNVHKQAKEKLAPRILQLVDELSKNQA